MTNLDKSGHWIMSQQTATNIFQVARPKSDTILINAYITKNSFYFRKNIHGHHMLTHSSLKLIMTFVSTLINFI